MDPPLVAHLITSTALGGAETRLASFLEAADKTRFRHLVIGLSPRGIVADRIEAAGVPVISVGAEGATDVYRAVKRLRSILADARPSILHSQLFHANVLGRMLGRLGRVPVVISGYASTDPDMPLHRIAADLLTARLAHHYTANCNAVAKAVSRRTRISPRQISVIYPGRSDPLEHRNLSEIRKVRMQRPKPLLLAVGRLHRAKGHDVLLDALAALPFEFECVVVGDGPDRGRLEEQASQLGLSGRVRFVGSKVDPSEFFEQASIFVHPSNWEGMPGALIEAMFWELPIVATAVGGIPEAVVHRKSALLVSPGDASALAAALSWLVDKPDFAAALASQARENAVGRFRIAKVAKQWEDLYDRLLYRQSSTAP
jgi:glycosyltransferase involved in cell wall biosynthesis